jgi:ABC-2 type transport system ATP-binding protein
MGKAIDVESLSKTFKIQKSFPGISGMMRGLFCPSSELVEAIHEISLTIEEGERVAFIGPNGAGKSTTIKMLTGILYPTSGSVHVLGLVPWKDRHALGFKIGTIFGQRTQLWYHLPPSDTFDLLAKIYELDATFYRRQLKELTESFEIQNLLHQPVRQLSLGQRMRCEIVASLLHNPQILFLDEPTIGLDLGAKLKIREFLSHLSKIHGTTLFLTSHDTADIEHICERVIVLNQGKILKDCSLRELKKSYVKKKIVTLTTEEKNLNLSVPGMRVLNRGSYSLVCEIDLETMSIEKLIHETLKLTSLRDVTIEDPSMTEIIQKLYSDNAKIS